MPQRWSGCLCTVLTLLRVPLCVRHDLAAADDLALDVPDAATQLGLFVARAVVDDVLPPAFIKTAEARHLSRFDRRKEGEMRTNR